MNEKLKEHQEITEEFLTLYLAKIEQSSEINWAERALHRLLKYGVREKFLPWFQNGDLYSFHKAFRQVDVTPDGNLDMAYWCLLQQVEIFWDLAMEFYAIKKDVR